MGDTTMSSAFRDRYDLHTHSFVSDGTTTPEAIAAQAKEIGLAGFALTDHDTTEGWQAAREGARTYGIDLLPGIELTTTFGWRSMHLLAYGPDEAHDELQDTLSSLREARNKRAVEMVRRLSKDFFLDWDALLALPETDGVQSLGRPHVADALVEAGYFRNRSEAFGRALSPSGPYYVPTLYVDTIDAIELIRRAGGLPVLAHPAARRMRRPIEPSMIRQLTEAGLGGIELDHPEHRDDWVMPLQPLARELGLIATGASDFHGDGKPNRIGERTTQQDVVERIRSQVATPR